MGGHRQVCGSSAQEISIEIVCKRIQDEEAMSDFKNFTRFSIVLCNAISGRCEGVCLKYDVGESVKQRETIEVEILRNQQRTSPRNSSETHLHPTSRIRSSEMRRRQSWQIG